MPTVPSVARRVASAAAEGNRNSPRVLNHFALGALYEIQQRNGRRRKDETISSDPSKSRRSRGSAQPRRRWFRKFLLRKGQSHSSPPSEHFTTASIHPPRKQPLLRRLIRWSDLPPPPLTPTEATSISVRFFFVIDKYLLLVAAVRGRAEVPNVNRARHTTTTIGGTAAER